MSLDESSSDYYLGRQSTLFDHSVYGTGGFCQDALAPYALRDRSVVGGHVTLPLDTLLGRVAEGHQVWLLYSSLVVPARLRRLQVPIYVLYPQHPGLLWYSGGRQRVTTGSGTICHAERHYLDRNQHIASG